MNHSLNWREIWEHKGTQVPHEAPELAQLLRANGYDTGHGDLTVEAWFTYVERVSDLLGARPGDDVYEIGCGAGAFLVPFRRSGLAVAGSDYSSTLVAVASKVLPDGAFECCEARDVAASPQFEFVVASGVFMYFQDSDYAQAVMKTAVAKARRGVALLDIPDLAQKEETIAMRIQVAGGQEEYEKRYGGLEHSYYARDWFAQTLRDAGAASVDIQDQDIQGYRNAAGRFNAFVRVN